MPEIDVDISVGRVFPVSVPTVTTQQIIISGRAKLIGWSLRETTGAAIATVEFQSGGNPIAEAALAAGGSATNTLGQHGVIISQNITLVVLAGSVTGAVYITNLE